MTYIPCKGCIEDSPNYDAFTLQCDIDPKKIVKKYNDFEFNKLLNEFEFVGENGCEYQVKIFNRGLANETLWTTVVSVSCSIEHKDVNNFFLWLIENFAADRKH